jgi:outer membrane protein OmpA-like peptidoglycan-associated protein
VEQTAAVRCAGAADAALAVRVSGGKGPFSFQWSDGAISGQTPNGLAAGTYQVTVMDAAGNDGVAEVAVSAPKALAVSVTAISPASTGQSDGQAAVNVDGGTAPYAFAWDNGETGEMASALSPGQRTVTVTDANGCTATAGMEITEDILPLTVSVEQTAAVRCAGAADAALAVRVSGGKGPFSFQWSDGSISGQTPDGLAAGTYQLTVTDAAGNQRMSEVAVSAPEALAVTVRAVSPASASQSDGQAAVNADGGTAPYAFAWDNGETGETASALAPGQRTVTVTDANGCTATAAVEITEDIKPLIVRIEQTASIQCAGETTAALQVRIEGGKGPFQVKWSDDSLSGEQATGLAPGDYQLTVTDASGQSQPAALTIEAPAPLTVEVAGKKAATTDQSEDGQAKLSVQGGSGNYTYAWDNGEAGAVAEALTVGVHSVTVTDGNGCSTTASVEIGEKIIKELARGTVRRGQTINIQRLQFEADSTNIDPSSLPVLDEIYEFLDENPSIVVEVGGHTNSLPPPEFCDSLSTARARAVAEYLVQKGIDPERVTYVGYGKRKPIFSNKTEDGRRRNQRVEIKILRL